MPLEFTDTHCHLDFESFTVNFNQLLLDCKRLGISRIIVPSIGPQNWQAVLALGQADYPISIFVALGIHPWFLNEIDGDALESLKKLAYKHQNNIVAIGEAGIDGKVAEAHNNLSRQIEVFQTQIALANQLAKPIIVHHRRSHQHIQPILRRSSCSHGGIIHAFSGSYQQAKNYLDLGFKLGVGGTITYPRAEKTLKTVSKLPLSSLVLETDAPSMPLYGQQGRDNSPRNIPSIFESLCLLRSEPEENIAQQLQSNVDSIFKF